MPLTINIGLSRKESKDFNSKGYTLNIEAEFPANVIDDPNALAAASNRLYQLADDIIDERIRLDRGENLPKAANHDAKSAPTPAPKPKAQTARTAVPGTGATTTTPSNAPAPTNAPSQGNNGKPNHRGVTSAQVKAIETIARRLDQNPDARANDEFGVPVNQLTIRQASELIDLLKGQTNGTAQGQGAQR